MRNNQKGFSAVEGLLIVVIVGLLGFVGWYVYGNRSKTTATPDATSSTVEKQEAAEAPPKGVEWKEYINNEYKIAFSYPSSWEYVIDDISKPDYGYALFHTTAESDDLITPDDPGLGNSIDKGVQAIFFISENTLNATIDAAYEDNLKEAVKNHGGEYGLFEINNVKGAWTSSKTEGAGFNVEIYNKGKSYSWVFNIPYSNDESSEREFREKTFDEFITKIRLL